MNRPEDDLERSLRSYFDDFDQNYTDDAPSPTAWPHIEAATKPAPQKWSKWSEWRRYSVGLAAIVLAVGLFYHSATQNKINQPISKAEQHTAIQQPHTQRKTANVGGLNTAIVLDNVAQNKKSGMAKNQTVKQELLLDNQLVIKNHQITVGQVHNHLAGVRLTKNMPSPTTKKFKKLTDGTSLKNENEIILINTSTGLNIKLPTEPLPTITANNVQTKTQSVDLLDITQLKTWSIPAAIPQVAAPKNSVAITKPKTTSPWAWSVSVQPFQTFQYITNNNTPQDFGRLSIYTPRLSDPQRTGIQLRIGIERQKNEQLAWRVAGFYRAMPQFVHYETPTNQFIVRETGLNQIVVERIGIEVKEHKVLQHFGLQTDYQYQLGRRWFVSGGGEVTVSNSRPRWGFTASLGWQRPLSTKHTLVIESTYTYFTNKTNVANQILQLQPYTIGLKVGIKIQTPLR